MKALTKQLTKQLATLIIILIVIYGGITIGYITEEIVTPKDTETKSTLASSYYYEEDPCDHDG